MAIYHDVGDSPLENPDLIALTTLLSGVALAIGGYAVAAATFFKDAGNYQIVSALDDMLGPAALVGMLFILGAYLGASAFWLASERPRDIVPLRVALGATTAGVAGFVAMLLIGTFIQPGRYFAMAVTLLAAFYGARLTTGLRREKPADKRLRMGRVALTASAVLVAAVLVSYKPTHWPGGAAPIADRNAWAEQTFKVHYADATRYVRACPDVTSRLGAVTAIGPAAGTNVVYFGAADATADFTLEVVGEKGSTLAHIMSVRPYDPKKAGHESQTSGELLDGDHAVGLTCR